MSIQFICKGLSQMLISSYLDYRHILNLTNHFVIAQPVAITILREKLIPIVSAFRNSQ